MAPPLILDAVRHSAAGRLIAPRPTLFGIRLTNDSTAERHKIAANRDCSKYPGLQGVIG